ncbi:MAG: TlyA family RNA methyltransferase [Elusimicrobia bacterium]|nr:TlyA family RNA methyltransferase [Elusimicrobiota bacterium]MBU2614511.1 TlyA family RNA methyltransferase [Elusimicrobiota bacterium]
MQINDKPANKTVRLDQLMLERKLVESREKAQALILSGNVKVNGETVPKASKKFSPDMLIEVKEPLKYVSRGGLKLEEAVQHFSIDIKDRVCLDIGSSTGGFTDCLLQSGAKKVYSTDVGKGLIDWKLRNNPKVVLLESINFRYFDSELLKDEIEIITIDVSFISLDKILPKIKEVIKNKVKIIALVKPQFEAGRSQVKRGIITDEKVQLATVEKIRSVAQSLGFTYNGVVKSPIQGAKGNTEYLIYLTNYGNDNQ